LANTAQARKRARQANKHYQHNTAQRSNFRTFLKKVVKAIAIDNKEQAEAAYKAAVPVIDKMVSKGLIHKNKAARHKSRLNARIYSIQAS
jgi:small subunit ribosomal protein S20